MFIKTAIQKLQAREDLTSDEIQVVFREIFLESFSADELQTFLSLLYQKGETFTEILGAALFLRQHGEKAVCRSLDLVDCCGTGGDQSGTFNISTATAFVLAGAGCHVAKHGNRAVTSQSGSADVLAALGVNISASKEVTARCIDEIGIGFLFAPHYYPLLKKVAGVRASLPHRTLFNILGPLINPAGAKRQLVGLYDKSLVPVICRVLQELGSQSAVVVHGEGGLDEFSLLGNNTVARLKDGRIQEFVFNPRQSGYALCSLEDLKGGTVLENAQRLRLTLKGHSQPLDHTVHINAAWALIAAEKAADFFEGLLMAQDAVSSGRAYQKLEELTVMSNS